MKNTKLSSLGVYGFNEVEPVILAALVTEDPLLLIGASGTGKTFLLNSLSEALGLEHRHYNASLISFDDLVGFPYPDSDKCKVRFLETPATVWGAESVLIDEISRCKPEHQNRLFSLIHERRIQGIALPKLRFRWAAMNPCGPDQTGLEDYAGSEPLDQALADRFALFVRAVDWNELTDEEKRKVADPCGQDAVSSDQGELRKNVEVWHAEFLIRLDKCPSEIMEYAKTATSELNAGKIRVSPRRARLLCRSLLAVAIIDKDIIESSFKQILQCSLPHETWGAELRREAIEAVHRAAWDSAMLHGDRKWLHDFGLARPLAKKLGLLLEGCPNPDAGTQAIELLLGNESRERAAAFAFAAYPAAVAKKLPIGAEAVNDLGKIASQILTVNGEISWQERLSQSNTQHPEFMRYARVIENLKGPRQTRAKQFFNWCLVSGVTPENPEEIESEINACISLLNQKLKLNK
jgi:MoxR-like ATPases